MSYSENIKAVNKTAAKQAIAEALDRIVASQPIHSRGRAAIEANAIAAIDLLEDDNDTRDVYVTINGYVTWSHTAEFSGELQTPLTGVSVCCAARYVDRV